MQLSTTSEGNEGEARHIARDGGRSLQSICIRLGNKRVYALPSWEPLPAQETQSKYDGQAYLSDISYRYAEGVSS